MGRPGDYIVAPIRVGDVTAWAIWDGPKWVSIYRTEAAASNTLRMWQVSDR